MFLQNEEAEEVLSLRKLEVPSKDEGSVTAVPPAKKRRTTGAMQTTRHTESGGNGTEGGRKKAIGSRTSTKTT